MKTERANRLAFAGEFGLLVLAGLLQAASLAWPLQSFGPFGVALWPLQLVALALLARSLLRAPRWQLAARNTWVFATVWLAATFWWLFISLHVYGGLDAVLAVLAVLALAAALAGYYALAAGLWWHLVPGRKRAGSGFAALLFAAAWTAAELARSTWLTGFGWGAIGYAHIDGPLASFAPWLGVFGMGALAAWLSMSLAAGRRQPNWQLAAWVLLPVAGWLLPVYNATRDQGSLPVTLLQGNIPQDEKFETGLGVPQALQWYGEELLRPRSGLVVAPETAIPLLPRELPDGYWSTLQQHFAGGSQAALFGIPLGDYSNGYTNSVVGLAGGAETPWRYDKHHLVPFGEFIPPLFKWFIRMMHIPLGDFRRGDVGQASFAYQGQRLAANICYEDLFGEELGVRFLEPQAAPTIFVNVSNIAWFGDSVAIDQHLHISRLRALEFQRPFVRATNTGATVVIDHRGQVTAALPRLTRGVLSAEVQGRDGTTPYAWWVARFGLWPWWLAIALLAGWAWRRPSSV